MILAWEELEAGQRDQKQNAMLWQRSVDPLRLNLCFRSESALLQRFAGWAEFSLGWECARQEGVQRCICNAASGCQDQTVALDNNGTVKPHGSEREATR